MNNRVKYFDLLRALAIICVIAIHSTTTGYLFNPRSFTFIGTAIWRQVLNFAVPLFLAISGYFIGNKPIGNKTEYLSFLKRQIPRVLLPYIVWSLLYSAHFIANGQFKEVLFKYLTFQTAAPFYFIALIIQYYLLLPLLKTMGNLKGLVISGLVSALSCVVILICRYHFNIDVPLYIYAGSFTTWLVFFVSGIYIRKNGVKMKLETIIYLMIAGLILSIVATFWQYIKYNDIINAATAVKVTSFFYSLTIILLVFKLSDQEIKIPNIFVYIGQASFGIYLSHIFILGKLRRLLQRFIPQLVHHGILFQLILVVLTLSLAVLFAYLVNKSMPKMAKKWLGQ